MNSSTTLESSDLSSNTKRLLQQQCDLARDEHRIMTIDEKDCQECTLLLESIPLQENTPDLPVEDSEFTVAPESNVTPRFADLQCIGFGAFGLVFSAMDFIKKGNETPRRVAIKILRPSKSSVRKSLERFINESKILTQLQHPHIVKSFGDGQVKLVPYFLVEWADGGSLAKVLSENPKQFTPSESAWLICKIAEALDEAHSNLVLHRDLKPGNILLRSAPRESTFGLGLYPLLTDFGLSKNLDTSDSPPLTSHGEVLGTLTYMSPEQIQGGALKPTSDLFSLGVILHELVYAEHPFRDQGHYKTLENIVKNSPNEPTRHEVDQERASIPKSVQAIIRKCLEKDPKQRYRSCAELTDDLRRFLKGEPISIVPPTLWQSLTSIVAKHTMAAVFAAGSLAFLLLLVALLNRGWQVQSKLAADRAAISQLFLQSMKSSNRRINDTILSGLRVNPSDLLVDFNKKLPLLEQALALDPEDEELIRQLEIMYHYQSLCYKGEADNGNARSKADLLSDAIIARQKSLSHIERLRVINPDPEHLIVAKINGLYNLSMLHEKSDQKRFAINKQAVDLAVDFLKNHPQHQAINETLVNLYLDRAILLAHSDQGSEEANQLFQSTAQKCLELYKADTKQNGLLTIYFEQAIFNGCRLLSQGKSDEAQIWFDSIESIISEQVGGPMDWRLLETLYSYYSQRSLLMYQLQTNTELLAFSTAWRESISKYGLPPDAKIYGEIFPGEEASRFFPAYLQWLTVKRLDGSSEQEERIYKEAKQAFLRCQSNPAIDISKLIKAIGTNLPTEDLERWQLERNELRIEN